MDNSTKLQKFIDANYAGDIGKLQAAIEKLSLSIHKKARPEAKTPVIIELTDVCRTYKISRHNKVEAVKNVSLKVRVGEIVALTGASGSGKSTLMHLIGGIDRPTSGELTVAGNRIDKLSEGKLARYRNQTIGFVFQFFYLQPFLKTDKNVEVPLMFAKSKRKTRKAVVQNAIDSVELTDRAKAKPKELSGGQMQRAAIARALVNQPKIILADEPTGNLDSKTSGHILKQLSAMREKFGTTMVIVTHDPTVAAWADREIQIKDGEVIS